MSALDDRGTLSLEQLRQELGGALARHAHDARLKRAFTHATKAIDDTLRRPYEPRRRTDALE